MLMVVDMAVMLGIIMIGTIVDCCDCGRMEGCSRDDALERAADGGSFVRALRG